MTECNGGYISLDPLVQCEQAEDDESGGFTTCRATGNLINAYMIVPKQKECDCPDQRRAKKKPSE